jgi:hypothetical protein
LIVEINTGWSVLKSVSKNAADQGVGALESAGWNRVASIVGKTAEANPMELFQNVIKAINKIP